MVDLVSFVFCDVTSFTYSYLSVIFCIVEELVNDSVNDIESSHIASYF